MTSIGLLSCHCQSPKPFIWVCLCLPQNELSCFRVSTKYSSYTCKNVLKSADLRVLTRLLHARAHILQWIYNYYLCATSCCNAERMFSFPGLRKMFIHEKINCTRPPIGALGQCSCVVKSCTYRQGKKWGNVPLGPGQPGWKRSEQHSSSNLCSWYQKDGTNF